MRVDFEVVISDESICQNGGTVVTGVDSVRCQCAEMFSGDKCQTSTL